MLHQPAGVSSTAGSTTSVVAVAVAVFAVAHPTSHLDFEKSIVETLKATPSGWIKDASEAVDKDATSITLKIHLVNKDMDKFLCEHKAMV